MARLYATVLDTVPSGLLVMLARTLAKSRPFGLYPGWKFAIEEDHPDWRVTARLRIWRAFATRRIDKPVRVSWYDGLRVDVTLGNDQSRCLYVSGSFEPNELAFLGSQLRPGAVFLDIGANEGFYTIFASRRIGRDGRVFAFEPSPRERARLERNVRINGLSNVTTIPLGLAEASGKAVLHLADGEHNGQNSLGSFGHHGVTRESDVEIALTSVDEYLQSAGVRRVDVVKMDVEGAEARVLRGAVRLLHEMRPLLIFELFDAALRGQGSSEAEVLSLLRAAGYVVRYFDTATGTPTAMSHNESSANAIAWHPAAMDLAPR